MFSTPLICSSSGAATVSAMTLGLAPGNWARTTTEGGTTSGYSEMGSLKMAMTPAMKTRMDRTAAKIGLSTKRVEMFMGWSLAYLVAALAAEADAGEPSIGTSVGASGAPGRTR